MEIGIIILIVIGSTILLTSEFIALPLCRFTSKIHVGTVLVRNGFCQQTINRPDIENIANHDLWVVTVIERHEDKYGTSSPTLVLKTNDNKLFCATAAELFHGKWQIAKE